MRYFSPAKLNLFFRVLRRREDGFHEIASLYQAINLGDFLEIELADRDQLTCTDPRLPTDGKNLVLKATDLFRRKTGLAVHAKIHLEKRVPIESGLGGGSSNAATTLWALNELAGKPASLEDLIDWSGEIGSDLSFFFSQGTAYCTGRGEIIQPLPSLPQLELCVAKPHYGLSTPLVYKNCKIDLLPPRDPEAALSDFFKGTPTYFNDLEVPAFHLIPGLAHVKERLLSTGYEHVTMTGSGTAFFCMGSVPQPSFQDLRFYPTKFLSRNAHSWYTPKGT
jgi:4-diphosphocytidyl-2-C-methyl-D-erythritol kinase